MSFGNDSFSKLPQQLQSKKVLRSVSSEKKLEAYKTIDKMKSNVKIIQYNRPTMVSVMASKIQVDLSDVSVEDLSHNKKHQKKVQKVSNSLTQTMEEFKSQIETLKKAKSDLVVKVSHQKQDLVKLQKEIESQNLETKQIQKVIAIKMKERDKITVDTGDIYRQIETLAKGYVEKESTIEMTAKELTSRIEY